MAAHTTSPPPLPSTALRHPSRNIKGLKFSATPHPFRGGGFLTPGVALAIVDAFAKFKQRGFTPKTITCLKPRPFVGKFCTLGVGLAVIDQLAKFKRHSLIPARNIEGGLNFF